MDKLKQTYIDKPSAYNNIPHIGERRVFEIELLMVKICII